MTEPEAGAKPGGWDAGTFLLAVALPLFSAGLLLCDILNPYYAGDMPLSMNHVVRLAALVMPVLGALTSLYLVLTGGSRPSDRRFYLIFLVVNLDVLLAWVIYWMRG